MTLTLRYAARSDRGLIRDGNQDSVYAGPRLLAVADGMGGMAAGDVASNITIAAMAPLDEDVPGDALVDALRSAVDTANQQLRDAVDANPAALRKAAAARYSSWALRETPIDIQERWFRPQGRDAILDGAIRTAVTFDERNLADDDFDLWQPETYDAIFCRNVVIYFDKDTQRDLFNRMARLQEPGATLFLGHSESLFKVSTDYSLIGKTIYARAAAAGVK